MGEKRPLIVGIIIFGVIIGLSVSVYSLVFTQNVEAKYSYKIPEWVKANAGWWSEGHITDAEFSYTLQWLFDHGFVEIKECEGRCI